ncbi:MAG: hypothetical protein K2J88_04895 [Oscillospiraceae bacterium]|nr:hypothetical protein [Oscillospiraceae bacterium]
MNDDYEDVFESHEKLENYVKKRRRKKKILAFILAIAILVTFAIPFGMMIPEKIKEIPEVTDKKQDAPLYAVEKN